MEKLDLRIQKTRKLLVEALVKLLETKPFCNIKLNEICEVAMVHKTTFYHHFADKYELLKYTIMVFQKEMISRLDENNAENTLDYYCQLTKLYMQHIKENHNFYKSILTNDTDHICMDLFFQTFIRDFKDNIPDVGIPKRYVSVFYVSAVFYTVNEWFKYGMIESEDEMVRYVKALIENHYRV